MSDRELREIAERPVPRAACRGYLRRRLTAGGLAAGRPPQLRALILGNAAGGTLLLAVAALGLLGAGRSPEARDHP